MQLHKEHQNALIKVINEEKSAENLISQRDSALKEEDPNKERKSNASKSDFINQDLIQSKILSPAANFANLNVIIDHEINEQIKET